MSKRSVSWLGGLLWAVVGLGLVASLTALAGCGGGGSSQTAGPRNERVLVSSVSCPHKAPRVPAESGMRRIRYPSDPTGATLCRFSLLRSAAEGPSGQLVRERKLNAMRASKIVALLNRTKQPEGRPEHEGSCPADDGTRILVRLQFAAVPDALVNVVPTGCRGIQQVRPPGSSLILSYRLEQNLLKWSHPRA